jgi:hypothetical protein
VNYGYFHAWRTDDADGLAAAYPSAFMLAWLIARRARYSDAYNEHGLKLGEAFLGDFKTIGLTRQKYRLAIRVLRDNGFATFRTTNRGTIAKLADSRLFSNSPTLDNHQNNHQPTNGQPTANHQPTTNNSVRQVRQGQERASKITADKVIKKREPWQLNNDYDALKRRIREEKDTTNPDRELIAGWAAQLKQTKQEIRLAASPPAPGVGLVGPPQAIPPKGIS